MSDVVVEPVAPDASAPENVAEAVADANEPAEAEVTVVDEPAEESKPSVEDAARVLLAFVDEGRKPGDGDLDAARDILRDVLG